MASCLTGLKNICPKKCPIQFKVSFQCFFVQLILVKGKRVDAEK